MVETLPETEVTESVGVRLGRRLGSAARPGAGTGDPTPDVAARVARATSSIGRALRTLAAGAEAPAARAQVAEWLLDNVHVLRESRHVLADDLPRGFTRTLPLLAGRTDGLRRVDALAAAIVAEGGAPLDAAWLEALLAEYQSVATLETGELWALPAYLRLAFLEDVARVAEHVASPGRRPADGDAPPPAIDERRIRRSILALRELGGLDWRGLVERTSRVEAILRTDPGGSHPRSDFETRDRTRRAVEAVARGSGLGETAVARLAVEAAARGNDPLAKTRHVAWHLLGEGRDALERAVGFRPRARDLPRRTVLLHPRASYFAAVGSLAVGLVGLAGVLAGSRAGPWGLAVGVLLGLVPAITLAVALVDVLATFVAPPRRLPRLDFADGIPDDARTLVVVPVLLARPEDARDAADGLERDFVGNEDPNVAFALLTDLADADRLVVEDDAAILEAATAAVRELNRRHAPSGPGPFLLLHRERRWSERSRRFMGWERKRGKLHQLLSMLGGGPSLLVPAGDGEILRGVRYVLTRDADSRLPPTCVAQLVATMAHPLHRAVAAADGHVVDGYGVLQPRMEPSPASARRTPFTRAFAGDRGLDPYSSLVSDVQHDLFGTGIFAGKGLIDVEAFRRSLEGRVPEDALLSHDLFEGLHARAGLVSDVVLLEDVPADVLAWTTRAHRWIRGDWQLLPWLRGAVPAAGGGRVRNVIGSTGRWRIVDNLRRSLVAPSLIALAMAGWFHGPETALLATLAVLATLAAPLASGILAGLLRLGSAPRGGLALADGVGSLRLALARGALTVLLLPYEGWVAADAVLRTLWRLAVSRRNLLEWTPAAQAERRLDRTRGLGSTIRRMAAAPLLAGAAALGLWLFARASLPAAAPLLGAWLVSPLVAHRLGRRDRAPREALSPEVRRDLRVLARRTWLYFERFVGPDDHWLPPDNFQEDPGGRLARRTSPSNVGLSLLSTLAAHDLGYVGLLGLEARLRSTFDAMARLETHRGHLYNWYETQRLTPLEPRYVSAVDSGNLVACLWALAAGCDGARHEPVARDAQREGLVDTIDVLAETLSAAGNAPDREAARELVGALRARVDAAREPRELARVVRRLHAGDLAELEDRLASLAERATGRADPVALGDLRIWVARVRERVTFVHREIETLAPWLADDDFLAAALAPGDVGEDADALAAVRAVLASMPAVTPLETVPAACEAAVVLLGATGEESGSGGTPAARTSSAGVAVARALGECATRVRALLERLERLSVEARRRADATDFRFLYDPRRRLLHLGYDASAGRLDPNHYDLLASEARLASLVGIAKGDLPPRHWLHLGRPSARLAGGACLQSWSGTLFEYLLPGLLLRAPRNTLLGESCDAAVAEQMRDGARRGLPWGVSESAFAELDPDGAYGYRAFGSRGLGLKRDAGSRYVVAPYASALALSRRPAAAVRNLARLRTLGMLGRYGFYEALDYGTGRPGRPPVPVRSYMVHHESMILVALCNALRGDVFVDRLRADARVRAYDLLLDERVPDRRADPPDPVESGVPSAPAASLPSVVQVPVPTDRLPPRTTILSNGTLSAWITAAGGGGLRWRDLAVTPWRPDAWEEGGGTWVYLRDEATGALWSVGARPVPARPGAASAKFGPHAVELQRREAGILARLEVTVAPWDDVEIRRLTLVNETGLPRRVRVTTASEVVLAPVAEARRHPAFARLFVESEIVPELGGVHLRRRPKSSEAEPVHVLQCLVGGGADAGPRTFETDRGRFLGRQGSDREPAALRSGPLAGRSGATLDPVVAISTSVRLAAGAHVTLHLVTAVASSRERAVALVEAHRPAGEADATFEQARRERERALRDLELAPSAARVADDLLSACLAPWRGPRPERAALDDPGGPLSGLWGQGISGDAPIVLLRLSPGTDLAVPIEALRLHALLRDRGAGVDLVLLDLEPSGYASARRERLEAGRERLASRGGPRRTGRAFLLAADRLDDATSRTLEAAAAVVLDDASPIGAQLQGLDDRDADLPAFAPSGDAPPPAPLAPPPRVTDLLRDNGFGGMRADGREYVVRVAPARPTPAPWCNVLSNPHFGCCVSEAGSGWTWALSSSENRLTPWRNDPVRDDPGEAIYLRDEQSGAVWSPTPLPAGGDVPVLVRHRASASTFERNSHGLFQELRISVAWNDPVKIVSLRLENPADRARTLTATYFAEWVLGTTRETTAAHLRTAYVDGALLARNPSSEVFGSRVAFLASDAPSRGVTCDRVEFLGRGGIRAPDALGRIGLSGAVAGRVDPCGALQVAVEVPARSSREVRFLLGEAPDRAGALDLIARHRAPGNAGSALREAESAWDHLLGAVHVSTPEPDLDVLMNGRLLHQVLACRMWGRSGLYQPGGAFGFRDQLQDSMALVCAAPELARGHLLAAARRQFAEGDVLHWWHPESGAGVRTRCSDDRLWLPYAVAHYVRWTGDRAILGERAPFLVGEVLATDERERYATFPTGADDATLEEHCLRALERDPGEGAHGLPLIGSCDWNDGMDRVGVRGRGESVWLGWFLYAALTRFAPLCSGGAASARADELLRRAEVLRRRIEGTSWDGRWYLRAFYDDGTPLGGARSEEARIDLVAQAWAVLSGAASPARGARAMASAADQLAHPERGLVQLLAPPFDHGSHDPGYIRGYPPGVRENGGQYTHAAVWGAWAFAVLGDGDTTMEWFRMLSPLRHAASREAAERYRVEPYVVAGDVCAGPDYDGRGGWTWYTGSAAWLYRLGLERILGIRRFGDGLVVDPCIPASWPAFEVVLRRGGTEHRVRVENPDGVCRGVVATRLDGVPVVGTLVPYDDDGKAHEIVVSLGHAPLPG